MGLEKALSHSFSAAAADATGGGTLLQGDGNPLCFSARPLTAPHIFLHPNFYVRTLDCVSQHGDEELHAGKGQQLHPASQQAKKRFADGFCIHPCGS